MIDRAHTDEELVELCRSRGKRESSDGPSFDGVSYIDQLLRRYEGRILRWCLHVLRNREDAADCAQDILVRVYKNLGEFRGESSFSTWVYTITRTTCFDALERRSTARSRVATWGDPPLDRVDLAPHARPATRVADREARVLFQAMFRRHITVEESRAMVLHHVDGHPMTTVTKMLGLVNPSGARAFLTNAKRKLRNRLSPGRLRELGYAVDPRFGQTKHGLEDGEGLEHGR